MFLRANKRFKDGKQHRYWSVVENRRVAGGRSVQKTLLYLGEINDNDRAAWTRAIEAVDERDQTRRIHLFPEDRTPDPRLEHPALQLRLAHIELARPRQWGGCWLALELWHRLDLDSFWQPLLPDSQKGTPWIKVLKTLVAYRLLSPGSEWKLHTSWFDRSAMADLLHDDFRLAAIDTLYRCHDRLLEHREALFCHLKDRWAGLFGASYDILLYDLTSTYFEVDAGGPVTEASKLKAFGYSRDKRPDCVQIVIALVITPEGLPIGYEVTRDELLLAIGAAKEKAGRNASRLVTLHLPASGEPAGAGSFRFELDRHKLKATRRHEGQYLLRSNLAGEDPAELWRNYMNLVRIEESFRTLKGDLGLRPVFHQLDGRIEAHIFISFLAYCLHITLEKYNKKAATGLSSRGVLERMSEIQMLDVTIPATNGREVRMRRYTRPEKVHRLLLDQLGFALPAQPPPEIRNPGPVVETY